MEKQFIAHTVLMSEWEKHRLRTEVARMDKDIFNDTDMVNLVKMKLGELAASPPKRAGALRRPATSPFKEFCESKNLDSAS